MAVFLLQRATALTVPDCWDRLTDWRRHGDRMPFTTVAPVSGTGRAVGDMVLARTAAGRWGFDDPMEIVAFTPPGEGGAGLCRLEKRGPSVRGWAELRVRRRETGVGADVLWVEEIRVRGVPAALDPITAATCRVLFGRALDGVLAG
jgi:hypothetical protein